ncbi:MAG: hypothetical protein ACRERS_08545, partial [Methylococcales bacterium]
MTSPPPAIHIRLSMLFNQLVDPILKPILLITAICIFVPFSPVMPSAGLDPSWALGLTQALAQGLAFGKELIFTFGPYASIYTRTYHPSTEVLTMLCSLYFALCYWLNTAYLMRGRQWPWMVAFFVVLAALTYPRDLLFLSYPLLVALNSFKLLCPDDRTSFDQKYPLLIVALFFSPFGMLALVKGNILILCAAIGVLCCLLFAINKRHSLAIMCLIFPSVSLVLFWIVSGQKLSNILNYFVCMAQMISGYAEAMAATGTALEIIFYLEASIALLMVICLQRQISALSNKIFLFCVFFIFLFFSYKFGFVRHDIHAVIPGT